jgi:hypothetical protein
MFKEIAFKTKFNPRVLQTICGFENDNGTRCTQTKSCELHRFIEGGCKFILTRGINKGKYCSLISYYTYCSCGGLLLRKESTKRVISSCNKCGIELPYFIKPFCCKNHKEKMTDPFLKEDICQFPIRYHCKHWKSGRDDTTGAKCDKNHCNITHLLLRCGKYRCTEHSLNN